MTATHYISATLSFAVARFETAVETVTASPYISALLYFAAQPIVFPLRSLRGRCRLRQMRCKYIRAVGATLLTYVSVSSVTTGRADAINVLARRKNATEKTGLPVPRVTVSSAQKSIVVGAIIDRPFFYIVAVSTADLITPHPSQATPSPQAPQGEGNDETSAAYRCINCVRRCNKTERINPFTTRCRGRQKGGGL